MGDINEMTYPDMLNRFRERRNESTILLPLMSELAGSFPAFKDVQSCLSIGPGPGEYDLEFARRCLPKLRRLVAVEKDHHCAEELKGNLAKLYDGSLDYEIVETDVEDFEPAQGRDKFDLIVMFHMLYDLSNESRKKLLESALNRWLEPSRGLLVVIHMSDDVDADGRPANVMQKLHRYFGDRMDLLLEAADIRRDLGQLGAEIVWSQKYRCDMDFTVFDADVTQLFNIYSRSIIDSQTMKRALQVTAPEGMATYVGEILIAGRGKKEEAL